jgi:hypothetical protein
MVNNAWIGSSLMFDATRLERFFGDFYNVYVDILLQLF